MLECELENGHYINHFGHIECWKNSFYIHALLGILVSVTFVFICLVVSLTYFESKPELHNHSARVNSRSDFFMLVAKIINILMFAFLSRDVNQLFNQGLDSMGTCNLHFYIICLHVFQFLF